MLNINVFVDERRHYQNNKSIISIIKIIIISIMLILVKKNIVW